MFDMDFGDVSLFEQSIAGESPLTWLEKAAPIKTVDERQEEWLKERYGKFTASEFHRLMTVLAKPAELPKGAITYVTEKAVEKLTLFRPDFFVSADMQWGIDHEMDAVKRFSAEKNREPYCVGDNQQFIVIKNGVGGTPDGLLGKTSGIEVKCPKSTTHFAYLNIKNADDLKKKKPEYYWQIQGLMYVSKRRSWYFVSYDPRFINQKQQIHIVLIKRNPKDIALLKARLALAVRLRDRLIKCQQA